MHAALNQMHAWQFHRSYVSMYGHVWWHGTWGFRSRGGVVVGCGGGHADMRRMRLRGCLKAAAAHEVDLTTPQPRHRNEGSGSHEGSWEEVAGSPTKALRLGHLSCSQKPIWGGGDGLGKGCWGVKAPDNHAQHLPRAWPRPRGQGLLPMTPPK